jgi:hypothetical protein
MVVLLLHAISILRPERPDSEDWHQDDWTSSARLALSRIASGRKHYIVQMVAVVFSYLCFEKKSIYLSNNERCPVVLLRHPNWWNREQFKASGHRGKVRTKSSRRPGEWCLTDEHLDEIPRRSKGCKRLNFTVLTSNLPSVWQCATKHETIWF